MCVFKNHAFIYFLRPPSWSGTLEPQRLTLQLKRLTLEPRGSPRTTRLTLVPRGRLWSHGSSPWSCGGSTKRLTLEAQRLTLEAQRLTLEAQRLTLESQRLWRLIPASWMPTLKHWRSQCGLWRLSVAVRLLMFFIIVTKIQRYCLLIKISSYLGR
jgi:hypothetical protein